MANILFVVHRYAPFPGGSEYYVQNMAEEAKKRGHNVQVLAHEHQGDYKGISVTNNYGVLGLFWNLIVVHGGDVISQNIVHINAVNIKAPVCYMIIKPSDSAICLHGMKHHPILAYSTTADLDFIKKHGYADKARRIRHGIVVEQTLVTNPVHNLGTFISAGGFYPNKCMKELAAAFEKHHIPNTKLNIFGYGMLENAPEGTANVTVHKGASRQDMLNTLASSTGYIMNSSEEGFGLVLLEAMLNQVTWFAKDIAGAHELADHGVIYKDEEELMRLLTLYQTPEYYSHVIEAKKFVLQNHTIQHTVNDIEDILWEVN